MALILKYQNNIEDRITNTISDPSTEELANNVAWLNNVRKYEVDLKGRNLSTRTASETIKSIKVEKEKNEVVFAVDKNFWNENSTYIFNNSFEENSADSRYNIQDVPIQVLRGNHQMSFLNNFEVQKFIKNPSSTSIYFFIGTIAGTVPESLECKLHKIDLANNVIELKPFELLQPIFDNAKPIAILVHGLGSTVNQNFKGLYNCLFDDFNMLAFTYPTVSKSIDDIGKDFNTLINSIIKCGHKEINIFAHSKGGIVSRKVINLKAPVNTLTMAGTPNDGAHFVRGAILISWLSSGGKPGSLQCIKALFNYHTPIGLRELLPGKKGYIAKLNNNEKYQKKYYILVGDYILKSDGIVSRKSMITKVSDFHPYYSNHVQYFLESTSGLFNAIQQARKFHNI